MPMENVNNIKIVARQIKSIGEEIEKEAINFTNKYGGSKSPDLKGFKTKIQKILDQLSGAVNNIITDINSI